MGQIKCPHCGGMIEYEKEPEVVVDDDFSVYLDRFNEVVGSKYRAAPAKMRRMLKAALKNYSMDEIIGAVAAARGCSFLMGDNPSGTRYLTPEYILRPEKLDMYSQVKVVGGVSRAGANAFDQIGSMIDGGELR